MQQGHRKYLKILLAVWVSNNDPYRTNDRVRRDDGAGHDTDANPPGHVAKQSGVVDL